MNKYLQTYNEVTVSIAVHFSCHWYKYKAKAFFSLFHIVLSNITFKLTFIYIY